MRPHLHTAALLLLSLLTTTSPGRADPKEVTIAGRLIGVLLVKANENLSPVPWPDEPFSLVTATITVQPDASVFDLLIANGIEPDVEAFTIIYDLNPSLKKVDPLPAGASVTLPKVLAGQKLDQRLRDGYRVMLTVDPSLRAELVSSVVKVQDLSIEFANLATDRFASPAVREATVPAVKALALWFGNVRQTFLQRTGPALSRQSLFGLHDECLALESTLSGILHDRRTVTVEDQDRIGAIHRYMEHQMKKFDEVMAGEPPAGEERYEVIVTIRNGDRLKYPQVFYTFEGLFRNPPEGPDTGRAFEKATSGILTFGDYTIWVGAPGRPFPPLTDQKSVRVDGRAGSRHEVVLTANP